jgi:tetratricopeptide (TPR) repeat protein
MVQYPNPRMPDASGYIDPDVLNADLDAYTEGLSRRVAMRELTQEQKDKYLRTYLSDTLSKIKWESIPADEAWKFGDAYRKVRDWQEAYRLYKAAVAAATDEDRRVNDRLRIAQASAALDKVDEAMTWVRSTFDARPTGKAPILFSVLYEVVPNAQGKGRDKELAELLESAIAQAMQTVVDAKTPAGRDFLIAREVHVRRAWLTVIKLYQDAGEVERARETIGKSEKMLAGFGQA